MDLNININARLKIGNKVICTDSVYFTNGKKHMRGQVYTVTPDTQAYFSLFTGDAPQCNYLKI